MANQLAIIVCNIFFGLKTRLNSYMAKSLAKKKLKKLFQADLFCKYSQFPRSTLWDQNVNLFFNKTSFTWILARLGLGAPSDTARFELGLQFDLMAEEKKSQQILRADPSCNLHKINRDLTEEKADLPF